MRHLKLRTVTAAVALALGAGAAFATLPPLKNQDGVAYLTGGVGRNEARSFEEAQSKFPLALEFVEKAAPRDQFIADVDVKVTTSAGKSVLATRADGPFLLADLPAGEYTVKATYGGRTLERKVQVPEHGSTRAVFVWDLER